MRMIKIITLVLFVLGICSAPYLIHTAQGQSGIQEASAAFDNTTNGVVDQATHIADLASFTTQEQLADGLGPVYDARSCGECHDNPTTGGSSQFKELHAGHFDGKNFVPAGGPNSDDQIQLRAIDPAIQERVPAGNELRGRRLALNLFGVGFVEAIDSDTIRGIAAGQPASMRGQVIETPLLEAPGKTRVSRFGWKNINGSLKTFAAVAYLFEEGITSPMQPNELTSNGRSVAAFDKVPDPEDDGSDITSFTQFMRALPVPPRDTTLAATADAKAGAALFNAIGCDTCHVPSIVTAPPGTMINGGTFAVPKALGNKRIRPFSDFLLHDIGTGDGIPGMFTPQNTRNKFRTPALWGLRTRAELMHDGDSFTRNEAILRHAGEATSVINNYKDLTGDQRQQLITFLNSL